MLQFNVTEDAHNERGWLYTVRIKDDQDMTSHSVSLSARTHKRITGGRLSPEKLVSESFQFLLQREPKEMILRKFELDQIADYFPEWEEEIKKKIIT